MGGGYACKQFSSCKTACIFAQMKYVVAMKLVSWNVNGLRAVLKKNFLDFVFDAEADILCLQETKATPDQVDLPLPEYPFKYWNSADKKGYSGTAIFSKIEPVAVTYGINIPKHDAEGRVITADFGKWFLVNVYVPNAKRDLARLDYRHKEWDVDFLAYLKDLEKQKPVVFCGDMNVAHEEIDIARPNENRRNAGFTDEERLGFGNIVASGFIDTFRHLEKEGGHYSWWSYMGGARERNIGWRIDYFCISPVLEGKLVKAWIMEDVTGSDHAPVAVELNL